MNKNTVVSRGGLLFVVFWFSMMATAASPAKPLKLVVVSDLNSSLGSVSYGNSVKQGLRKISQLKPDLVLGVGDYVAGEDISHKYPLSRFEEMWRSFFETILNPLNQKQLEFAPSPGNHDASGYSRLERERNVYVDFWNRNVPRLQYVDQQFYPYFYSYRVDDVFFISMDDVTPFRLNQQDVQRNWIRNQLSSPLAQSSRARIVYGHVPLYPLLDKKKYSKNGRGKYHEYLNQEHWEANEDGLEKLFIDQRVDLAIFAHSHAFFPGRVVHRRDGKVHQLRILSMPCLGSGARYLEGKSERSKTGFAVINIDEFGKINIEGKSHQGDVIDRNSLPERVIVPGRYNRYYRDDVEFQL